MSVSKLPYRYVVSYTSPAGVMGTLDLSFGAPITVEDWPLLVSHVRENATPSATVLGFSLFAPDRVDGTVKRDATLDELRMVAKAAKDESRDLAAQIQAMTEEIEAMTQEIETLKREAGLLP